MSRLAASTLVLLTLAGAAHAQETKTPDTPLEAPAAKGNRVLWVEPLWSTLGLAVTAATRGGERDLLLSGGYAHPLGERTALTTELFLLDRGADCGNACASGYTWVRTSVGVSSSAGGPGRGALIQTRLILGYSYSHAGFEYSDDGSPPWRHSAAHDFSVQAGLDVGYQWVRGPLYLAAVCGVSAGVSTANSSNQPHLPLGSGNYATSGGRPRWVPVVGLNLNLLRVGYRF